MAKKLFAGIMYSLVFAFSIFAVLQIRLYSAGIHLDDLEGNFNFLFFHSRPMSQREFVIFKLTLFFITGTLSFILMCVNFFSYHRSQFDLRVMRGVRRELRKELRERKKKTKKKN